MASQQAGLPLSPKNLLECDWAGEVDGLKGHADSCAKRLWECEYCGLKCMYGEGEGKHRPTCRKFPEPCPNGCEVGSVERCNVEQHRRVCSLEPVACEMKEFGCSAVVPRKELATHMRESELQHLTAMAVLNLRLSRQLQQDSTERDRKITRLQQDMAELQSETTRETDQIQHKGKEIDEMKRQPTAEQSTESHADPTEITTMELKAEMEKEMADQKKEIAEMKQQMSTQKQLQTELKEQVKELVSIAEELSDAESSPRNTCRAFTFIQYSHRKGIGKFSQSDLFYSHHHGYKFKLNIDYHQSPQNDIGAYLYLVTGEYDDQLHWPVEVKGRLELLNQAGTHRHVQRASSFKWEKRQRNSFGVFDNSLMTYSDLESCNEGVQYMMNDSLKFRIRLIILPS